MPLEPMPRSAHKAKSLGHSRQFKTRAVGVSALRTNSIVPIAESRLALASSSTRARETETAKRALTCIAAQGRTSHGLLAWPSQVIDSESVSRQITPQVRTKSRESARWDASQSDAQGRNGAELNSPPAVNRFKLDRAHRPIETDLILQARASPSMHRYE